MKKSFIKKGDVFNNLTIIKEITKRQDHRVFECRCKCNSITKVLLHQLKSGKTKSCGCYRRENARAKNTKHGFNRQNRRTAEYRAWLGLRQRCYNPNNQKYENYGGRGIKCLWMSFQDFINDMGLRPSSKHSIGRIDNDGHYCKENCQWENSYQQMNNTSRNVKICLDGHEFTLSQLSRKLKIKVETLWHRIFVYKWSIEKTIGTPVKTGNRTKVRYKNIELPLKTWSKKLNKSYTVLRKRRLKGWSAKKIFETPIKKYKT